MKRKNYFEKNVWLFVSILLLIAIVAILITRPTNTIANEIDLNENTQGENENNLQERYFLGNKDAPVVMTEYSSFTCPFCKRFKIDDKTFENIKKEYIDTGKVKYIYKHFTRNETDIYAANAAECAGEQNKFYEYINLLYTNQASLQLKEFEKYAKELNLNTSQFNECLISQKYNYKIEEDKTEALANGITGTPGFIINGEKISGAQPFSIFKQTIDKNL